MKNILGLTQLVGGVVAGIGKHKLKLLSQVNVWRTLTRDGC